MEGQVESGPCELWVLFFRVVGWIVDVVCLDGALLTLICSTVRTAHHAAVISQHQSAFLSAAHKQCALGNRLDGKAGRPSDEAALGPLVSNLQALHLDAGSAVCSLLLQL